MTAVRPAQNTPGSGGKGGGAKQGGGEKRFRLLPTDRSPDDLENEVLALWREEKLFEQTLAQAQGKPEFVFFE
ncbi:MAG TPA: hypothetical protein VJS39_07140, partial [Gemmatimonadaceae bacterium]|nr:hypothetical protein [Gemmatimonadaceae bacterium]